ncbi:MAG: class I SAM-dependent methyltransferase [Chloroflexota bacterium]
MTTQKTIDESRLLEFVGKVIGDVGALMSSGLVVIGDRLGLYRAMNEAGPITPAELAQRTDTSERYVREWLLNQAASGYIEYDPASGRYVLPDEHAVALTDEASPFFLSGCFQAGLALVKAEEKIAVGFTSGVGVLWGEQDSELFEGAERVWKPGYQANLVQSWIPALEGVDAKLRTGARVADIGCGHGASTIIMAQGYPASHFVGYDNHAPSIEHARRAAYEVGVADRVRFEVADATSYPRQEYDLIAFFDAFHDLGDPVGAARHAREALAPDGALMLVEPMAGERVEENFNPIGRVFSGFSVLCCTPNAMAACGCDQALGTIATEQTIRDIVASAGFTSFRRAAETPFNRVFEARA